MAKNYADVPEERGGIGKGKVIGGILAAAVIVALLVFGAMLPKAGGQKSVTVKEHIVGIPGILDNGVAHSHLELIVRNNSNEGIYFEDLPKVKCNGIESEPISPNHTVTIEPGRQCLVKYEFDLEESSTAKMNIVADKVIFKGMEEDDLAEWVNEEATRVQQKRDAMNADVASGGNSASAETSGQSPDSNQGQSASTTSGSDKFDVDVDGVEDAGYGMYEIKGTVVNNTNRAYDYAQIEFSVYDASGALIGSAMDNCNNLKAGGTWKFEAVTFGLSGEFDHYELEGVSAF